MWYKQMRPENDTAAGVDEIYAHNNTNIIRPFLTTSLRSLVTSDVSAIFPPLPVSQWGVGHKMGAITSVLVSSQGE